jgi:hypothetical protein
VYKRPIRLTSKPAAPRLQLCRPHHDLEAESRRRLDETVTRRTRDVKIIQLTRAAVLTQVTTHAMHHRAQFLNMRSAIQASPPPSSVAEWTSMGDTQVRSLRRTFAAA